MGASARIIWIKVPKLSSYSICLSPEIADIWKDFACPQRTKEILKDFGKGLGISIQHLPDIELDKKRPCHDFFYHMVKVYRVNLNYLSWGEGKMFMGENEEAFTRRVKPGY